MYKLIGCPMHFGVSDKGLKKSIDALNKRYADLKIKKIKEVNAKEVLTEDENMDSLDNLKNLSSVVLTCQSIAQEVDEIVSNGEIPLFIGGDHSASIGSVSGAAQSQTKLGLLWIDSHSDINTDASTITGNIHGMPVSALMGFGNEKLVTIGSSEPKVLPQHIVLFGVRDMDPLERDIIERLGIKCYTYEFIEKTGLKKCLKEVKKYLSDINKLHISFDLDSMNPDIIKGVTVPVKDGFVEEDVYTIIDYTLDSFDLSSIDIVEYNPKYDEDLYTAEFTYGLIKRILEKDND